MDESALLLEDEDHVHDHVYDPQLAIILKEMSQEFVPLDSSPIDHELVTESCS